MRREVIKLDQVVKTLESYYSKAPSLPVGAREFIVSITPWLSLIFGVLIVLASLSAFGLSAVFSPFATVAGGAGYATGLMVAAVLGIAQGVLMVVAFPSLKKRVTRGWMLIFWVEVIALVGSFVTLNVSSVVMGVIVAVIAFYFLFQIKPY
ncbi:MAG: hypothetical protein ACD_37C00530G0001, partial [uncultured bacterium]